jgi:porin
MTPNSTRLTWGYAVRQERQRGQRRDLAGEHRRPLSGARPQYHVPLEAYYVQFVAPWLGFTAGKISPRSSNVFMNDETSQFMNTAFNFNLAVLSTVPIDFLEVGAILQPTDWLTVNTMVLDSDGADDSTANVTGFETAFDRGTSVFQQYQVAIKPFDQQGHQRLSWTYSDKERIAFQQDLPLITRDFILKKLGLGSGPTLSRDDEDWAIVYDFDQYLYTKPGTKDQGVGIFGNYGVTSGKVNPVQNAYVVGVGGKGMIPTRDNDTFGVGYYYTQLSDDLKDLAGQVNQISRRLGRGDLIRIDDEQGVELYYNIAVTPWLHVTPDLQVIDVGRTRFGETAVVAGLRMKMDF